MDMPMSNEEHWQRLTRVEGDLDILKPQVAGLQTDVQYIRSSIDQLIQRNHAQDQRAFPWGAVVSLVSVVVLVLGGFASMLTSPVNELALYNREEVRGHLIESHDVHMSQSEEVAYLRGQIDALTQQVQDIDNRGSRRWNQHPE